MQDLRHPKWMYLKAGLFVIIGLTSSALIIGSNPSLSLCLLLGLAIWAFCRAYYFMFYVIEKYIDPDFKFSGLFSALKYAARNSRTAIAKSRAE
jgi:hypothetical protein